MTTTTSPALLPGTHATVTRTITDTWAGDIPAGAVVTIVEFDPEHVAPEDYAADLGGGRIVSFMADDLAPVTTAPAADNLRQQAHTAEQRGARASQREQQYRQQGNDLAATASHVAANDARLLAASLNAQADALTA